MTCASSAVWTILVHSQYSHDLLKIIIRGARSQFSDPVVCSSSTRCLPRAKGYGHLFHTLHTLNADHLLRFHVTQCCWRRDSYQLRRSAKKVPIVSVQAHECDHTGYARHYYRAADRIHSAQAVSSSLIETAAIEWLFIAPSDVPRRSLVAAVRRRCRRSLSDHQRDYRTTQYCRTPRWSRRADTPSQAIMTPVKMVSLSTGSPSGNIDRPR